MIGFRHMISLERTGLSGRSNVRLSDEGTCPNRKKGASKIKKGYSLRSKYGLHISSDELISIREMTFIFFSSLMVNDIVKDVEIHPLYRFMRNTVEILEFELVIYNKGEFCRDIWYWFKDPCVKGCYTLKYENLDWIAMNDAAICDIELGTPMEREVSSIFSVYMEFLICRTYRYVRPQTQYMSIHMIKFGKS